MYMKSILCQAMTAYAAGVGQARLARAGDRDAIPAASLNARQIDTIILKQMKSNQTTKQNPSTRRAFALTSIALTAFALSSFATLSAAELAAPKPPDRTAGAASSKVTTPATPFQVGEKVLPLLEKYCLDCHDADTQKGDVRLDSIEGLSLDARLDLLNRAQEKIFFGEMPPKKKEQPTEAERNLLTGWLSKELRAHNASKLEDTLRKPEYGNVVDHEKLFSGKYKDLPGFTPDRRWLISEFIFDAKFNRILGFNPRKIIDGKHQTVIGDNNRTGVNLTNPFLLPTNSGVRYYDTTMLSGGHLLTMINNAREASGFMLSQAKRNSSIPAYNKVMAAEWEHEKILAARQSYLDGNIEPLLRELYQGRHEALLPVFVATRIEPPTKAGNFDTDVGRDDKTAIWDAMQKHFTGGEIDEALIMKCEREWFNRGVHERSIQIRQKFMRGNKSELDRRFKLLPKPSEVKAPKPPADSELINAALQKQRKAGDTYSAIIAKCMAGWAEEFKQERLKTQPLSDTQIGDLVEQLFTKIIERAPSGQEKAEYSTLTKSYVQKLGTEKAINKLSQSMILRSDIVYRFEFGEGQADVHGRKMLSPRDASYAIAYALTDSSPDKLLVEAANSGRLNTREDYRREVQRMLKARDQYYVVDGVVPIAIDSFTDLPIRKLRFFREFFGYPALHAIFKDNKRFGGGLRPPTYDRAACRRGGHAGRAHPEGRQRRVREASHHGGILHFPLRGQSGDDRHHREHPPNLRIL